MAQHSPPTTKQMRELRRLADLTGTTFAYPDTVREASREIDRMRGVPESSRSERYRDRRAVADQLARGTVASAPREDEIRGYGSSARWANARRSDA